MPGWLPLLLPPTAPQALAQAMLASHTAHGSFAPAAGEVTRALAELELLIAIGQLSHVDRELAHARVIDAAEKLRRFLPAGGPRLARLGRGPEAVLALATLVLAEQGIGVTHGVADLIVSAEPLLWAEPRPPAPGEIVLHGDFDFAPLARLAQRRAA